MATESAELIAKLSLDNARFKKQLKEAKEKIKEFGDQAENAGDKAGEGFDKAEKGAGSFSKSAKELKSIIGAALAADTIIQFGKAIVNTTAEFQKMEAVLTNTLGSNSAAKIAMNQIVDFAQQTPFQVNELTDAFVKLANRGFIPTMDQMKSMGDLASSVGKSFDQLAEAVLDAQTGEFERLKEFGIRASAEGDKVQFTFKGITTEVQKSDQAIQEYLISLGKMHGVAGAMESISKTTGGIISNLQDNIVGLFKDIGDSSSGFINWFIKDLNRLVTSIRHMSETIEGLNPFTNIATKSEDFRKFLLTVSEATTDAGLAYKDFANTFNKVDLKKLLGDNKFRELFISTLRKEGNTLAESQALWNTYINIRKKAFDDEQKLNSLKKEGIQDTSKLTEEQKKRQEANQKFYKSAIELSTEYNDKLLAEYGSTKLISSAYEKIATLSEKLVASMKPKGIIDVGLNLEGYEPPVSEEDQKKIQESIILGEKYKNQLSAVNSVVLMLGNTFQSAFEGMLNTGKISFKGIIDGLKALIVKLIAAAAAAAVLAGILMATGIGAAGGFLGNFKKIFGTMSGLSGLFNPEKMAEGGMVTGLTHAILGDNKSGKEAVIPFEKMGSFLSQYGTGGGNVRVEVVGSLRGEDIFFSGVNYQNGRNKLITG